MNNSLENSRNSSYDNNKLIEFCQHFKFVLLEELVLEDDYRQLHYGNCAVIGNLHTSDGSVVLQNVRYKHIPCDYRLPLGVLRIPIIGLNETYLNKTDMLCVVHGEVVLIDKDNPESYATLKNTYTVHNELIGRTSEEAEIYITTLRNTLTPAIKALTVKKIEHPNRLIDCNLRVRTIIESTN